jgi:hypothetical protein
MTDEKVFGLVFGMMAGALFGWLAPALVSLAIICLVTFGYYASLLLDETRYRWLPYSATVREMSRQW